MSWASARDEVMPLCTAEPGPPPPPQLSSSAGGRGPSERLALAEKLHFSGIPCKLAKDSPAEESEWEERLAANARRSRGIRPAILVAFH